MRYATLALAIVLSGFAAPGSKAQVPASNPPGRIIVKFKQPLAQEIESALPSSLVLSDPGRQVRPAWFQKHPVKQLKPLYGELVRQKKGRGLSMQQQAEQTLVKFPIRSMRALGTTIPDLTTTYVLDLDAATDAEIDAAVAELSADPDVEYAERDQLVPLLYTPNDPYFQSSGTWGQSYPDLWALHLIDCPTAWDTTTG